MSYEWKQSDIDKLPKWTKKDGPTYGVYSQKPIGHRCIWACKWITKEDNIPGSSVTAQFPYREKILELTPPPNQMDDAQKIAELEDIVFMINPRDDVPQGGALNAIRLLAAQSLLLLRAGMEAPQANRAIILARPHYDEYVPDWLGLDEIPLRNFITSIPERPGWPLDAEVRQAIFEEIRVKGAAKMGIEPWPGEVVIQRHK